MRIPYVTMGRKHAAAMLAVAFLVSPPFLCKGATPSDASLIEGAKLCTSYLPRHERQYGIPVHLLAAIASTESGRYNKEIGLSLPWPWTINVEGKGYFFDTKEEAIATVKNLQQRGVHSIDVGCMQVNLHHHPNAFADLEQAFDPAYNIAYAAQFLKRNFDDEGSWRKATADYHSHTPIFGDQYARLVYSSWSRIINKVADARSTTSTLKPDDAVKTTPLRLAAVTPVDTSRKPQRHTYHALHMHKISVSRDTTRENGVLVIRPSRDGDAFRQQASLDDRFVTSPAKAIPVKPASEKRASSQQAKVQDTPPAQSSPKGQFNPGAHIVRVNSEIAAGKSGKPDNVFVFDN